MTKSIPIDNDENADWLHKGRGKHLLKKDKKSKESMEPFKPQDGEQLQRPRTENFPTEKSAHGVVSGKRNSPRGYANSKREK